MSVEEIKKAICELPREEREKLIGKTTRKVVRPTSEQVERAKTIIDKTNAEGTWVSWDDLKTEAGV